MKTESIITLTERSKDPLRRAIQLIEDLEFSGAASLRQEFLARLAAFETFIPAEYPERYRIRASEYPIEDHLREQTELLCNRLHVGTSNGRKYVLTSHQRTVLRDRYGMTPTKEVIVTEISTWPSAPTCVRHLSLRSTDHVDTGRKHVLNAATITDWVTFCSAVDQAEHDAQVLADHDRIKSRVTRLLERAKEKSIEHSLREGQLTTRLLAEYDQLPDDENRNEALREAFREILLSLNAPQLAELVKEPKFFDPDAPKVTKESTKHKSIEELLSQYD